MGRAAKPIFALLVVGAAAFLAYHFLGSSPGRPLQRNGAANGKAPPPALDPALRLELEQTADLVAPGAFEHALERFSGTPAEAELRAMLATRARLANDRLETRVDDLLGGFRYRAAGRLIDQYVSVWFSHRIRADMVALRTELEDEQAGQVEARCAEAEALLEIGKYEAARETIDTSIELEEKYLVELKAFGETLERRIRVAQHQATAGIRPGPIQRPNQATKLKVVPAAPPALPGIPHPDVKRLAEARAHLVAAQSLFRKGRYIQAAQAVEDLVGYYGDLSFIHRQTEAIQAMNALARHKGKGIAGLLHATRVEKKGKRLKLTYTFESDEELLDWEALPTIPHRDQGEFTPVRNGIQGHGVMTYLLRAYFENDVVIRATSRPNSLKSHGLAFCQAGLETRQLLWLVTNHWFVEGENYVKARPGHSLLMFGKGVNNDVPDDSPEIGFIFRGRSITSPAPAAGGSFKLQFRVRADEMSGGIVYKGESGALSGSCKGDDGRGVSKLRPGLFVLENSVTFRDVVIEGKVHKDFERGRINELLELVAMLE